jgi:exodeoxyribonuclease V alpha subunit
LRGQGEVVTETLPLPVLDGTDTVADMEIAMLPHRHRDETQLALHVRRLIGSTSPLAGLAPWTEHVAALTGQETAGLTDEQYQAILTALTRPLSALTGGPGCGKTTPCAPWWRSPTRPERSSPWPPRPGKPPNAWKRPAARRR